MLATEILARCAAVWGERTVPYSQVSTATPTGHRADCSGYVSAVLDLPAPGLDTVTLLPLVQLESWDQLEPGDLLGILGPGSEGDAGHVAVFTGRAADGGYEVWEQSGGEIGPHPSTWAQQYTESTFLPYRPKEEDMPPTKPEQADQSLYTLIGSDTAGYPGPNGVDPKVAQALADHNLAAVEARLAKQIGDGFAALGQLLAGGVPQADVSQFLAAVQAAAERGAVQALDGATIHAAEAAPAGSAQ